MIHQSRPGRHKGPAALDGISYQPYLKQAAVRQDLADRRAVKDACPRLVEDGGLER